jgi:hypothetical protein
VSVAQISLALAGLLSLSVLTALHDLSAEVSVPIIVGIVSGGLGHTIGAAKGG